MLAELQRKQGPLQLNVIVLKLPSLRGVKVENGDLPHLAGPSGEGGEVGTHTLGRVNTV